MELHFLRPYWVLALLPTLYLCWRLTTLSLVANWRTECDSHLLSYLLVEEDRKTNFVMWLLMASSVLLVFALMGPSFEKKAQPIFRSQVGNVLVLDLAPSMADSVGSAKKIDKARFKMIDYLNGYREGQVGLVVYTDEAYVISPLTEDSRTIINFIPSLDPSIMPTYNDEANVGVLEGKKLLKQAGLHHGNIILITDKITDFASAKQAASNLLAEGYHLQVLDVSQQPTSNTEMKKLAEAGGGHLISLTPNNSDIEALLAITNSKTFTPPIKKTKEQGMIWQDNGRIFVLLLLPLALICFRRGYFR